MTGLAGSNATSLCIAHYNNAAWVLLVGFGVECSTQIMFVMIFSMHKIVAMHWGTDRPRYWYELLHG